MIPRRMVFAFLFLLCLNAARFVYAAEPGFHPYISLKEEYNDNIDLTPTNQRDDFITTVQPGIRYSNMGKQAGVDLNYALGRFFIMTKRI